MVWERLVDESSGRPYYYNSDTESTQWEFPIPILDQALDGLGWSRVVGDENQVYYYSESKGESIWDLPEGILKGLQDVLGDSVTLAEVSGEETEKTKDESNKENGVESTANNVKNKILDFDKLLTKEPVLIQEPVSSEEAKEEFFAMLKEAKVDNQWSFSMVIKELICDRRYWLVEDAVLRQQLFEIYLIKKADFDFEQSSKKREEYKKAFIDLLKQKDIQYYSRWQTVSKLLINEKTYKEIPEKFKIEFFEDYVNALRVEHEKGLNLAKEKELKDLRAYLDSEVKITTTFDSFFSQLQLKYTALTKLELLKEFDLATTKRGLEMDKVYTEDEKLNYTSDRVARRGFKKLLSTIERSPQLKWISFLNHVRDKPEFVELCGHNGSSPIEFYWDIIDEENVKLRQNKDLIRDIFVKSNISIDGLTLDQFVNLIRENKDKNVKGLPSIEIELIFKQLRSSHSGKRAQTNVVTDVVNKRSKRY